MNGLAGQYLELADRLRSGKHVWLFLDYDGTLAEFAPTPEHVLPDAQLIDLLTRLSRFPRRLRLTILSGRPLSQIQVLLPIPGILLAGTYGIEYRSLEGETHTKLDFATNRPVLDWLKPQWQALIQGKQGFYLEDKGWSLALHARFAEDKQAASVISAARQAANNAPGRETFSILGGHRFLEIAPSVADKGQSVAILLDQLPWPDAQLVYIGDDDKDEQAFEVVRERGGLPILVSREPHPTQAEQRLPDPAAVRQLLTTLADTLEEQESNRTHP